MLRFSQTAFSRSIISDTFVNLPLQSFLWRVQWYHKTGGIKRDWFLGASGCPISKLNFEMNLKIMGAGTISLAYLDFPVDADDYIKVWYNGTLVYKAFVENSVDAKGGAVKLIPYHQKFSNILYNGTFAAKTVSFIFQTIVQAVQADTGVVWISDYVDTGSVDTLTLDYSGYESPKKIFDELTGKLDDRYWGVDVNNIFRVYTFDTDISKNLFNEDGTYTEIEVEVDYSKIEATRYQVFKKTAGAGEASWIGQVGYGSGYATLTDIENQIGKIEKKFTVSEVIASTPEALGIAYNNLVAQAVTPKTIVIKNLNLSKAFPEIGDYITVQDRTELIMETIVECDTATGWIGSVSLDTSSFIEATGSIRFTVSAIGNEFIFDFGELKRFYYPFKISFMGKATVPGQYVSWSTAGFIEQYPSGVCSAGVCGVSTGISDYLFGTSYPINIYTGGVWQLYEKDITDSDFQYIGFKVTSLPTGYQYFWIDRIQLYLYSRQSETANVVKLSVTIDQKGDNAIMTLGQYDLQANNAAFKDERKIEKLESITTA